ncbi:DUF3616 domain-containing protein [Variovorax sp. KBW07]|uniref:DUF3616 domain-containing protein n=1 Tax=Variovorax sp. KBW07 TaxID=2153358 RepID=UPI000F56C59F|nr:DUF3616 domain-containing protein [Variovorax sp. KBW07]RQO59405.1 DUF3616 domain-containing protein [Variovorax sp. KBW07]
MQATRTLIAALLLSCAASSAVQAQTTRYTGICDASAAVGIGRDHFVVGDDERHVLFVYRAGSPAAVGEVDLGAYLGAIDSKGEAEELDIEGAARIGDRIYWITSHGANGKGEPQPTRRRFFATTVVDSGPVPTVQALKTPPYTKLLEKALADPKLAQLFESASKLAPESEKGLNIEGLAATPDGQLLIGFRNPRPEGKALVLPLRNPAAVLDTGADPVFGEVIRLDLGQRGIRSLEWGGTDYRIVGGPHGDRKEDPKALSFELYKWAGAGTQPVLVPQNKFGDINPEALFRMNTTGRWYVLSDDGGVAVGKHACKKKKVPVEKKGFRGMYLD